MGKEKQVQKTNGVKSGIILAFKGFIMGVANLIPGISGGTIAIILGVYDRFVHVGSHFLSDFKNNMKFIIPVLIGIVICFLSMSSVIKSSFANFPLATTLFFVGLVLGGIPMIANRIKTSNQQKTTGKRVANWLALIVAFAAVMLMALSDRLYKADTVTTHTLTFGSGVLLVLMGVVVAATTVIPGISGSLLLMLFGWYDTIISALSGIGKMTNVGSNIIMVLAYGAGLLVGLVLMSKLVEYLFARFRKTSYYAVMGFIVASVIAIPIVTLTNKPSYSILEVIAGLVLLAVGALISYRLGREQG